MQSKRKRSGIRPLKVQEMVGRKFNMLTVTAVLPRDGADSRILVKCDCGTETDKRASQVSTGKTRSCGCLVKTNRASVTHGLSRSSEYKIWAKMIRRCENPRDRSWQRYGGRGIGVSSKWKSFVEFYADMGPRPSLSYSIDRIDNDGNYEPGNCRWATAQEQCSNRRSSIRVVVNNELRSPADIATIAGLSPGLIRRRINDGWHPDDLVLPVFRGRR